PAQPAQQSQLQQGMGGIRQSRQASGAAEQHRQAHANGKIRQAPQDAVVIGDVQAMFGVEVQQQQPRQPRRDQGKAAPQPALRQQQEQRKQQIERELDADEP